MNKHIYYLIVAALFVIHGIFGAGAIKALSPTYDEHVHLVSGYSYFKTTDYKMNGLEHPPLAELWSAVPLLFMQPSFHATHPFWQDMPAYQYPFSDVFMYHNRIDAEKMLRAGRFMILLLSFGLGAVIFLWARWLFGPIPALVALFLWSFSSVFISHGTLVTTDMALTLFYFSFFCVFWRWRKESTEAGTAKPLTRVLLGAALGLLLVSKFSAVAVFPSAGLIIFWLIKDGKPGLKRIALDALIAAVVAVFLMAAVYQFVPLTDYYLPGLKKIMGNILIGRSTFLMGEYSTSGWLRYFPVVFALKTPIPFMLLLAAALLRKNTRRKDIILFVVLPAAVFFAMSCLSKVQIGFRHIMPVFPFLTVLAAGAVFELKKPLLKFAALALLLWYAAGTVRIHPWHLSYFNEFVGDADNGYLYLTDSNLDWGQGMKELSGYLRSQGNPTVFFSYFGVSDPHYYGIKYIPVGFIDTISDGTSTPLARRLRSGDTAGSEPMTKVYFVVSATNLQATYYADKRVFAYLKEIKPEKIIAHSIFVYNLSDHPEQYEKFKAFMKRMGYNIK